MKYMLLIYPSPTLTPAQAAEAGCTHEDWMLYDKTLREAGVRVAGEALTGQDTATTVRLDGAGERAVTDGPFAETRELLGGFYVLDVPDLDVALDWAARCPGARAGGGIEVRPVADYG